MIRRLRQLRENESGAAIVELALSATIFATMVAGIVDISNAYSRKLALEQAVQRAIEKQLQTTDLDVTIDDTIKNEVVLQAGGGLTTDKVTITRTRYCSGAKRTNYSNTCAAGLITMRYLSVKVWDDYSPILPIKFGPVTADGKYRVTAEAGTRIQ